VQPLVEATAPSTSTVTRTIQAVEATHQTAIETIQSAGYHALVHETAMTQHVTEEGRSVPSSASSVLSRSIVEAAPAAVVSQPMVTEVKPAATVAARPAVEAMQAPVSVQEQIAVRENATQPASPVIQEASVREIQDRPAPAAKADYGWLAQALWDRVARLKHYPHMARVNHLEGRVVVRAIIKEDGHLAEVGVAESSGHPVLDQDALEVIRRACPLKLRHPLGWPQVVVQVPINYRLEN
jgi:protein TonB